MLSTYCLPEMLHYRLFQHPSSDQWITFVHGAGGSGNIWYKQIKDFKERFNVLVLDLRGHGESAKSDQPAFPTYTFKMIGNDVMELLNYLKIKRSHFIGISLGTIIIREIEHRFPHRISSLIMGGAVMKINPKGQFLMKVGNLLKSVIPFMWLYKLFAYVILPRRNHKKSRSIFIREAKKLDQFEFRRWFSLVAEVNPLLKQFRSADSKSPIFYIMGAQDHMFLPSVKKMVSNHQNSSLTIVSNCGHVVNIEKAETFNKQVIKFIDSKTALRFSSTDSVVQNLN